MPFSYAGHLCRGYACATSGQAHTHAHWLGHGLKAHLAGAPGAPAPAVVTPPSLLGGRGAVTSQVQLVLLFY
jgi:hypothetical protein